MIKYHKHILQNGLRLIIHQDKSTPIVAVNTLYNVGARDEHYEKTGFAHLFEHLMFGGSKNIPIFDQALQKVGGENNAFTNNNFTNYYITIPKENIDTALWLESDRMLELNFSQKSLDVQKNVVMEEFKQRYLNQPYGDVWLLLRPLVYKVHPYQWATIGKNLDHIKNATLENVKDFFYNHYAPNNAILTIAGNVDIEETIKKVEYWYNEIPKRDIPKRLLPAEPKQTESRFLKVERDVPFNRIYKAYHMCARNNSEYYATDLISDVLSNGKSAQLYQHLVKEKQIFTEINAYITGDIDNGIFIITGQTAKGFSLDQANKAIENEIQLLKTSISDYQVQKVKNKVESTLVFSEVNILNKAMNLSVFELLGDAKKINQEISNYQKVNKKHIIETASNILTASNCSTLYYQVQQN